MFAMLLSFMAVNSQAASDSSMAAWQPAQLQEGGARLDVTFDAGMTQLSRRRVLQWVQTSARAVSHYYGKFPVPEVRIVIEPVRGDKVMTGNTQGDERPHIRVLLGEDANAATLDDDWVMTHEMVHLAFPQMRRRHHWIEEGIATYVEPIARTQIGTLDVREVWRQLVRGLPKGLPAPGDRGLDNTPTWGRTYWGGALFCLLAEVQIRERTHNRFGLQDALRGILDAGGDMRTSWPIERALKAGDAVVGVNVLQSLYARMKAKPEPVDLDAMWNQLGVIPAFGTVHFDNRAPLANIRAAITAVDSKAQ